jgi:kynurenine formamidase
MSKGLEIARLLQEATVYDISPTWESNMPGFRNHPSFWIIPEGRTYEYNGYYAQMLVMCEHHGSHVDAPAHIVRGAATLDQLAPDILIGPYKKYDFIPYNPEAGKNMSIKEIKEIEEKDGFVPEAGDIILLQYGWDKYYKPESTDPAERDWYGGNVPGINEEAIKYFTDKKVRAVGSDAISTDNGYKDYKIDVMPGHDKYWLPNGILITEGFVNMSPAPATGLFVAVPLKFKNGSGSPIRTLLYA